MEVGVVIPVGGGRLNNLLAVLDTLAQQTKQPKIVVLICDGPQAWIGAEIPFKVPTAVLRAEKHEPGMEQPRNLGVRLLGDLAARDARFSGITHVWFLDTDVLVRPRALEMYEAAMAENPTPRIMVGPYEWLPPGAREPYEALRNDPRWPSFEEYEPGDVIRGDLAAGLACFSGNLVWPIEEFKRVGGFWDELHHGRCEDGELGLRAVHMDVPISFVREARGWHIEHERNLGWIQNTNAVDVPKLNERHPWVELGEGGEELFVVDKDGKRFDVRCKNCGWEGNSAAIWQHRLDCPGSADEG